MSVKFPFFWGGGGLGGGRGSADFIFMGARIFLILFRECCFGEENSVSLTEFWGKLGEFCEELGEFALTHK